MEKAPMPAVETPINPLKSEHLNPGVKPIMACVADSYQFRQYHGVSMKENISLVGTHNINYYPRPANPQRINYKSGGVDSFVISPVDSWDKFSKELYNCTGLIVTGREKKTGRNISFLSHQDSVYFLRDDSRKKLFIDNLRESLDELKTRSEEGTIDAVIFGGYYLDDDKDNPIDNKYKERYISTIELLSEKISEVLGFEPVVIAGPKLMPENDDVLYDNENRNLYFIRPEVGDATTESFLPRDLKNQQKKWEK